MENISDFDFYLKFTKPLVLTLPKIDDRVLAAAWVKRLKGDTAADDKIKLDYLKLFLFVLQRKTLTHPFTDHPNNVETLTEFPKNQTLVDVAKSIIEKEQEERRKKLKQSGDFPPFVSDFSADLLEYVAVQDIRHFGVHGYYALSKLPLSTWYRVDKQLFPKAAKSMIEVTPGPPPLPAPSSSPDLTKPPETPPKSPEGAAAATPEVAATPEAEAAPAKPTPKRSVSPKKSTLGASPPSRPIGTIVLPSDREPPSWGSNLLEVKHVLDEEIGEGPDAEVIWASPTGEPSLRYDDIFGEDFGAEGDIWTGQFSPGLVGDFEEEEPDARLSMWFEGAEEPEEATPRSMRWEEAPSLPYLTPPYPHISPSPPRAAAPTRKRTKKPAPVVRQTKSSLLLKKKAQQAAEPPPSPPKKKPKPSASKDALKKGKGKGKGKKPAAAVLPTESDIIGEEQDDVDATLANFIQAVQEIQAQAVTESVESVESLEEGAPKRAQVGQRPKGKPKKKLSALAKRSIPGVPQAHGAPVSLDESIHLSPEARQILEELEAEAGPSDMAAPYSSIRSPLPRLPEGFIEEEEEVQPEGEDTEGEEAEEEGRQVLKSSPGRTKDHRVARLFDSIAATSQQLEGDALAEFDQDALEALGLQEGIDLGDLEVDIANISGDAADLDLALNMLQAEASTAAAPVANVNVLVAKPAPVKKKAKKAPPKVRQTKASLLLQKKQAAAPPPPPPKKKAPLKKKKSATAAPSKEQLQHEKLLQEAMENEDFEEVERLIEAEMKRKGEDPQKREKDVSLTRRKLRTGRKKFLKMHSRVEAQLEELQEEEERQLDLQQQLEDLYRRLQPNVRPELRTPPMFSRYQAIRDVAARLPRDEGAEEEEFAPAQDFFGEEIKLSPKKDPRAKPLEHVFPGIDAAAFLEDLDLVEEEPDFLQSPPLSPAKRKKILDDIEGLCTDLIESSPGLAGAPLTTPKPSGSPRRTPEMADLLLDALSPLEDIPTTPESPTDAFGLPHIDMSPLVTLSEKKRRAAAAAAAAGLPTPRAPSPRASTPKAPTPPGLDADDDHLYFTSPPQEFLPMSPEKADLLSPEQMYFKLKPLPFAFDPTQISPEDPHWLDKKEALKRQLYGSPKTPTVFDVPTDRMAGETPPQLASPERSPISPPIDAAALRAKILEEVPQKYQYTEDFPVYRRRIMVGPRSGRRKTVNRYTHPIPGGVQTFHWPEVSDQLPLEDILFQEELKKFDRIRKRRPIELMPTRRETQARTLQRHSGAPEWAAPIRETREPTPPKVRPDMFDLPELFDVMGETPPRDVLEARQEVSPSSPEDQKAFKRMLRRQPMSDYDKTKYKMQLAHRRMNMRARRPDPDQIPAIPEDVAPPELYSGWSPVSRREVDEASRLQRGPRRKAIRKKLKKRKIDFSQPEDTTEVKVHVEEVETEVDDREFPESPSDLLQGYGFDIGIEGPALSPPGKSPKASPRTPPRFFEEVEIPEDINQMLELTPPSPLSDYAALQRTMAEVREHELVPRRRQRRRIIREMLEQIDEENRLQDIEEVPFEERGAMIRDEIEAEVEAELVAKEEEEKAKPKAYLDESPPSGLPSPMKAPVQVPFYETPPHLKLISPPKRPQKVPFRGAFRDLLLHERMPELASPEFPSPPAFTTPPSRGPSPKPFEEEMPEEFASPVSPVKTAADVQRLADFQYGLLGTPRRVPVMAEPAPLDFEYDQLPDIGPGAAAHEPDPFELMEMMNQWQKEGGMLEEEAPERLGSPSAEQRSPMTAEDRRRLTEMKYGHYMQSPKLLTTVPASPEDDFEEMERMHAEEGGSPPFPLYMPAMSPRRMQQLAEAQYAGLSETPVSWEEGASLPYLTPPYPRVTPPPRGKPTPPPRRGRRGPVVRQTRSSQLIKKKSAQAMEPKAPPKKAAVRQTRSSQLLEKKAAAAKAPPPPPKKAARKGPIAVRQTRSSQLIQKKNAAAAAAAAAAEAAASKKKKGKAAAKAAPAQAPPPQVPPPQVLPPQALLPQLRLSPEGLPEGEPFEPQPGPSSRPDGIEFEYREKVVEVGPKPERKTRRLEIDYDMEVLQQLGLREDDMRRINFDDLPAPPTSPQRPYALPLPVRPTSPGSPSEEHMEEMRRRLATAESRMYRLPVTAGDKMLPTRYKFMRSKLKKVPESEEEQRTPSPVGWNMNWDLPAERRVEMRAGDIQVLPSPLKDSRFKFERVELEEQPPITYFQRLPLAIPEELSKYGAYLAEMEDFDLGIGHEQMPDVFQRMETLEETEATADMRPQMGYLGYEIGEEPIRLQRRTLAEPRFGFEPGFEPMPVAPEPSPEYVSPERPPGAEMKVEEVYDEEGELWEQTKEMAGTVPPAAGLPDYTEVLATADAQYAELMNADAQYAEIMADAGPTPSPVAFKRRVQQHEFDDWAFRKRFRKPSRRPPKEIREAHAEAAEALEAQAAQYVPPPPFYVSPDMEYLYEESPPLSPRTPEEEQPQMPEVWDLMSPEAVTEPEFYSPQSVADEQDRFEDIAWWPSPVKVSYPFGTPVESPGESPFGSPIGSPVSPGAEHLFFSPPAREVSPRYRVELPSPERPQRIAPVVPAPIRLRDEIPEPLAFPRPIKYPTPSPQRPTRSQGMKPVSRRIDFDQLRPATPEEPVQVLTAGPPTAEEEATVVQVTGSPQITSPQIISPTSPTPDWDFDIPEHLQGFKWMD